jgi:hypothetical protein
LHNASNPIASPAVLASRPLAPAGRPGHTRVDPSRGSGIPATMLSRTLSALAPVAALALAGCGTMIGRDDPPPRPEEAFAPQVLGMAVPVVGSADDLDLYVGRLVVVRGVLRNTKPPYIAGVEVYAPDDWRHDQPESYAVGILTKTTVTETEYRKVQDDARKAGNLIGAATLGPGVHYRLCVDLTGNTAEARRLCDRPARGRAADHAAPPSAR